MDWDKFNMKTKSCWNIRDIMDGGNVINDT